MAIITSKTTNDDNRMSSDFHLPSSKKALIIFTRNPELGKVKTRLAKSVGDKSALEIYKFLLKHTVEMTESLDVDKFVYYSDNIHNDDIWNPDVFRKKLQTGADLGERMENSFSEIFKMGYQQAIIIGSDMFDMDKKDLQMAFDALEKNPYVIGPATDGGYYLLGMREVNSEVFKNKEWSTSSVLDRTLENLKFEKHVLLKERNDIDYYQDIKDIAEFQQFLPPHLDDNFL